MLNPRSQPAPLPDQFPEVIFPNQTLITELNPVGKTGGGGLERGIRWQKAQLLLAPSSSNCYLTILLYTSEPDLCLKIGGLSLWHIIYSFILLLLLLSLSFILTFLHNPFRFTPPILYRCYPLGSAPSG